MSVKYRLLKPLPGFEVGTMFVRNDRCWGIESDIQPERRKFFYSPQGHPSSGPLFHHYEVRGNQYWFEEISEEKDEPTITVKGKEYSLVRRNI